MNVNSISEVEKFQNNEFLIMNISNGVTTRHQLNKITKLNQNDKKTNQKPKELTEEEKRKLKIEKEKYERDKIYN